MRYVYTTATVPRSNFRLVNRPATTPQRVSTGVLRTNFASLIWLTGKSATSARSCSHTICPLDVPTSSGGLHTRYTAMNVSNWLSFAATGNTVPPRDPDDEADEEDNDDEDEDREPAVIREPDE